MHSYAQTNIQLFNQLHRDGYSNTELSYILNAYKLAMCLFTGCFRASGKTFIAHLVGTASILSSLKAPAKVVVAGLIHATYTNGDFGNGDKGISDAKRKQIRLAVGKEVEEYVYRYTTFEWEERAISAIHDGFDALDPIDRDVILIRLANELEEHLDHGLLYCGDYKRRKHINHKSYLMVEMAQKLGFPTLSMELARVLRETACAEIPMELRDKSAHNASFAIAPKSYQKQRSAVHWFIGRLRHLRSAIVRRLRHLHSAISMNTKFHAGSKSEQR